MDKALEGGESVHRVKRGRKPATTPPPSDELLLASAKEMWISKQQTLAMRIWNGQSPDVAVIDRVARIANGLKAQGLPLDVTLPHKDAARYMEAHK